MTAPHIKKMTKKYPSTKWSPDAWPWATSKVSSTLFSLPSTSWQHGMISGACSIPVLSPVPDTDLHHRQHRIWEDILESIFGYIWRCPEIGVPPVIIPFSGIFPFKPSILGYPHLWKPPFGNIMEQIPHSPLNQHPTRISRSPEAATQLPWASPHSLPAMLQSQIRGFENWLRA